MIYSRGKFRKKDELHTQLSLSFLNNVLCESPQHTKTDEYFKKIASVSNKLRTWCHATCLGIVLIHSRPASQSTNKNCERISLTFASFQCISHLGPPFASKFIYFFFLFCVKAFSLQISRRELLLPRSFCIYSTGLSVDISHTISLEHYLRILFVLLLHRSTNRGGNERRLMTLFQFGIT